MADRRPQRSAGELAAYQLGFEVGLNQPPARVQRRHRREVHIRDAEVVLIEEEIYIEERFY